MWSMYYTSKFARYPGLLMKFGILYLSLCLCLFDVVLGSFQEYLENSSHLDQQFVWSCRGVCGLQVIS